MWLLETKSVPALREWANISVEDEPYLTVLVERARKDKRLKALYEQGTDLLYEKNPQGEYGDLQVWQPPAEDEAGLCLLLALAALPSIRTAHALRHIDPEITRNTCRDIGTAVSHWKAVHATAATPIGIDRNLLPWFRLLASGELYRLGRLEFVRETFSGPVVAFREKSSGAICLLATEGTQFDKEGYVTEIDAPGSWQARLQTTEQEVIGAVIAPSGLATKEIRTLSLSEWEPLLKPGDPALEIHIPEGAPLDSASCHASLATARAFFPAKYQNLPQPKAFFCHSWLLDPAWQKRLGEDSNIVRFQKEGVLYPINAGRHEGVYYIFFRHDPDPATAPRDTRLQQTMLTAIQKDEPLRSGGLLISFA